MRFNATLASIAVATALAATPASAAKITVTQYGRIIATLPWAVALDKGMFKEAGLHIDGVTAGSGGGTSMRNLLASEIPVGEVSTSVALAAARSGVKLKIIYAASNHVGELAWASKPGSGVNTIKDLVGKKIAFTNPRSTTEMIVRYALKKEGLTDKVTALPLGGLGPALTALSQGAVAAAPLNDPRMTLHPKDYHILFYAWQYYPKFSWSVGVTTEEFAKAHPDIVRKIVEIHRKAVEYIYAHRKAGGRGLRQGTGTSSSPRPRPSCRNTTNGITGMTANSPRRAWTPCVDGLHSVGELKGPVDWSKLIDQEYLDKDLRHKL